MFKFGEKLKTVNKKQIYIIGVSIAVVLLTIIGAIGYMLFNKTKVNNLVYSSELERAEIEQMRTYDQVEKDDSKIENCPNIEFDAFFTRDLDGDGYSEGIRGSCIQIGKEDTLYMELHINDGGIFKNGKISINSDNFYFDTALPKSDDIKENAISNNTKEIFLTDTDTNQGTGKQITLTGAVRSGNYDSPRSIASAIGNDITKMSNNAESKNRDSVTLTGTYVSVNEAGEAVETEINKTVYFNLDWYGTTSASLPNYLGSGSYNYKRQEYNINDIIDEENQEIHLDFKILTRENNYQLNLSNSELKINLPEIQGYSPIRVESENAEVKYIYDETNPEKILGAVLNKKAVLNENNIITENAYTDTYAYSNAFYRYNIFKLKVTYPIDAYNKMGADAIQLRLPIQAHYEGYNNPNSEFETINPYKSNVAKDTMIVTFKNPTGNAAYVKTTVGKYYSSPWYAYLIHKKNPINVYNGISENIKNDIYEVNWYGMTGSSGKSTGLVLKENEIGQENKISDKFITATGESVSMEDAVKNVGIYMSNPEILLGEDGWVKVYDDDDDGSEPLVTFTKENWSKYNQSNPYKYDEPVLHIRIETSSTNADSYFYFYSIKEINTDYIVENYTKEEFLDYKYIQSSVVLYLDSGEKRINSYIHQASYEPSISLADVYVSERKIPTTEERNFRIYINTETYNNQEKWVNGTFLLKLPQEMASVQINDVTVSNSNVKISNYELYKENDETFIKIITENIDPQSYTITVDCNIIPDSTAMTANKYIELYAINEHCMNYHSSYSKEDIYDINKNENLKEIVGYDRAQVQFVSTNNLLTSQIITNYDDEEGNITYAPSVAGVVKVDRTARINIKINNNYSGTNSEVVILGRTPFEGNKYVDSGKDMNSTFTAIMSSNGIIVPEAIKNVVTVYYSENGEATQEFNEANNWQTVPTDFSKVKSFMIKFNDDYKLQRGEKHEFYYDITIPQDVALNAESYSHHAVYFCWDTPQGKYKTKVEPSKIGISPIEKFNLELTKYQTGFDKLVSGAIYSVSEVKTIEDGEELVNSKTAKTDENGKLLITGLHVNKVYEINEVKTPDNYELNEDVIRISTTINSETKELSVEKIKGNIRGDITVSQEEHKVSVQVEDETKAKLRLIKSELGKEDVKLTNARFTVKGEGLPTLGKGIITDENGIAELSGLKIGSTYTIEETKAPNGYYLPNGKVSFKIVNNNNGTFTTEIEEGTVKDSAAVVEDYVPVAVVELTNEKIPIFKLIKIEETTNIPLSGVRFKLSGKGMYDNGTTITTNESGEITLSSLYLNEEYTLKETRAKQGYYIKTEEIKFQIINDNGNYSLVINQGQEIVKSVETTEIEGVPALVLTIENEKIPVFKIVKTAEGTNEPLSRVRYNISGKGLPEKGTTITTNDNGETLISNLYLNEVYTLQETEAKEGYYIKPETIRFRILNNKGDYSLDILEGSEIVKSVDKTEVENVPYLILNMDNEKIPTFNLDITKVEKDKPEMLLGGAKFRLYRDEKQVGEYISDENGKIIIPNLCQYVEEKKDIFNSTYTLKEVESPEGYVPIKDITFKVQEVDGTLKFIQEPTEDGKIYLYEVEGDTIKLVIEDTPTFKLIKVDGETTEEVRIPNTKFAIFNIDGDGDVPATDSKGNIIGTPEIIDGKQYYTLTTDENGEFRAELQEGFYKAIEVQIAEDKFELSKQVYFFGIGKSKKSVELKLESLNKLFGDMVQETSDGGYIGYKTLTSDMQLLNGDTLTPKSNQDAVVVKYDSLGNIEWYKQLSAENVYGNSTNTIKEIQNGKYIVSFEYDGPSVNVGNGTYITNYVKYNSFSQMTVIYDNYGNVEYAINGRIQKEETQDGGYVLIGEFQQPEIIIEDNVILKNSTKYLSNDEEYYYNVCFIAKYDINGKAQWNKVIEADKDVNINYPITENQGVQSILAGNNSDTQYFSKELYNGSYMIVGNCYGSQIDFGMGNHELVLDSGAFFAIYDINGNIVNARISAVTDIVDTADGGFITYGNYYNDIDLKKEGSIEHIIGQTSQTGLLVKYNKDGITECYRTIEEVKETSTYNSVSSLKQPYFSDENEYICVVEMQWIDENDNYNTKNLIVKYNSFLEEIWRQEVGEIKETPYCNNDTMLQRKTSDNGYIFYNNVSYGEKDSFSYERNYESRLIKVSNEGIVEFNKVINYNLKSNSIIEKNGNIFIEAIVYDPIYLENEVNITENGTYLICYNNKLEAQWKIKCSERTNMFSTISYIVNTLDNGFILNTTKLDFEPIDLGNNVIINGPGEFIIKYDANNIVQEVIRGGINSNTEVLLGTGLMPISNVYQISLEEEKILDLGEGLIINGPGEFLIDFENKKVTETTKRNLIELKTNDGGAIKYGYFYEELKLENGAVLTSNESEDGLIVKYDKDNNIEWQKIIGGQLADSIEYMMQTEDSGFLAISLIESLGTINLGNGTFIENTKPSYVMIKYDNSGNALWYDQICDFEATDNMLGAYNGIIVNHIRETNEGKYILDVSVQGTVTFGDRVIGSIDMLSEIASQSRMTVIHNSLQRVILQYTTIEKSEDNPIVEYAKSVDGELDDSTELVKETKDGGYYTVSESKDNSGTNLISKIQKYTSNGEIALEIPINTPGYATSIDETTDGGCVITINNNNIGNIIKFDNTGKIQYNKPLRTVTLNSIIEISEGEYVVGGALRGESIDLGNGITIQNNSESAPQNVYNNKLSDGIVIKYKETESKNDCNALWAKSIAGTNSDTVNGISKTQDNGILVAGSLYSSDDIDLGNGVSIKGNSNNLSRALNRGSRGMLIKYSAEGNAEWAEVTNSSLKSAEETSDGGYVLLRGEAKTDSEVTVTYVDRDRTYKTGCAKGDFITIEENHSEVEGYRFIGWNNIPSSTEASVCVGDTLTVTENITLYAVWEQIPETTYEIVRDYYINNVRTGRVSSTMRYTAKVGDIIYKKDLVDNNPNWNTYTIDSKGVEFQYDENDPEQYFTLKENPEENIIVLKYIRLTTHTITYTDGCEGGFFGDVGYNLKYGSPTPTFIGSLHRRGYTFCGWNPSLSQTVTEDITYSAIWQNTGCNHININIENYNEECHIYVCEDCGGITKFEGHSIQNGQCSDCAYAESSNSVMLTNYETSEINVEQRAIINRTLNIQNITKLDRNRIPEWTKNIENSNITSIKETIEGGYIAGGIRILKDTGMAEPMSINRAADDAAGVAIPGNGIILKLNRDGQEEWRREIEKGPINDVTQIRDTGYIGVGSFTAKSLEFENGIVLENQSNTYREIVDRVWNEETEQYEDIYGDEEYYYSDGMIIKLNAEMMIPEKQELTVKNYYKHFNITTEVEPVNGVKVGSITGEGLLPYEEVVYGNSSTKPIVMTPENENYEIVGITVNGKDYPFEVEADGTFTMPQFDNVIEDKHIVVKYCYKENKIILNKIDSETKEPLEGAIFKLMPEGYVELDYLDQMTHDEMDQYYFEKSEDGSYKSNNQGMSNTQAHSSIEVDLTDYEGEYLLEINASISSENPLYNGVVTVVEQTNMGGGLMSLSSRASLGSGSQISRLPLINISGNVEAQNYTRVLTGGSVYTINFIYNRFDNQGGILLQSESNNENSSDTFTINSVKVMSNEVYTVETKSNGQGITNIPFGKYTIKEIQAPDGYVLNSEPIEIEFRPAQTGEDAEAIHTFTIENTKKSKVIVHYYKIDSEGNYTTESLAEDVILTGNPDETYTTDIIKKLEKDGIEYELENTIQDDGTKTYVIPENSTGKFILGEDQEVTYYYMEKKVPLIVHHYIQGTTVGVPVSDGTPAKDERFSGKEGDAYTTEQLLYAHVQEDNRQLLSEEYEFVEAEGEVSGTYGKEEIVVTYYYKKVDKNVSIFKYATEKQINEETGLEEEVKVPLPGAEFTIVRTDSAENTTDAESSIRDVGMADEIELPIYTTDENGKIDVKLEVGEYEIVEVKAPEGYVLPEGDAAKHTITVNKETEDGQLIEIENKKPQGTVITYHYKVDKDGNRTEIPVQVKDGENLVDVPIETQTGDVGSIYATKPVENLPINWKFVESDGQTSGTYQTGDPIVVKYYYREIDFNTETINLKVTKIWQEDNELQALRRPRRIKFIVTSSIDLTEQSNLNEKNASQGNLESQVPQEKFENQVLQETITSGITNNTELPKESENKSEENTEDTNVQEVSTENVDNKNVDSEDTKVQETNSENNNQGEVPEITEISVTEEQTTSVTSETTPKESTTQETMETPITVEQTENTPLESMPNESTTPENSEVPETTVTTIDEYSCYVEVGKNDKITEYTFENLPKYDIATGKLIKYTVDESWDDEDGSEDDLKFYKKQVGDVIPVTDSNGNIIYTARIINTFTIPDDNLISIKGIKEWNDRNDVKNTRPQSIVLQLIGRINKVDAPYISKDQSISAENNWQHTFEGVPMYTPDGQEIEYSIDELESIELNKYSKTITSNENKTEFTIKNTLNVQSSGITKTGTEKLRATNGKVNYKINYIAELDANYQQQDEIIVTVVDKLPYKISEKERNIAGGIYDEELQTITWTGKYNTQSEEQVVIWNDGTKTPVTLSEEKQVKIITLNKEISFSYLGITPKDIGPIVNNVTGTIKLEKSEEKVEVNCKTIIEWAKDVIVNKVWNGDTEETRPDSITVQLKQVIEDENGNESIVEIQDEETKQRDDVKAPFTITKNMPNEKTEWTYTYKDLPRYDEQGNEIKYTVVETEVNYTKGEEAVKNEYYCEKTEEVKNGNTIITLINNKFGNLTVTKVDSRNEEVKLSGAEFKLEKVIKNEETGEFVVPEENSEDYVSYVGTTAEDGTLRFENLKYGYYKLTETKAPEDYRISREKIEVIEVNSSDEQHVNAEVTVKNDKKYSLPLTGGTGTNIIRSAGILIISLILILLPNVNKKVPVRRKNRK